MYEESSSSPQNSSQPSITAERVLEEGIFPSTSFSYPPRGAGSSGVSGTTVEGMSSSWERRPALTLEQVLEEGLLSPSFKVFVNHGDESRSTQRITTPHMVDGDEVRGDASIESGERAEKDESVDTSQDEQLARVLQAMYEEEAREETIAASSVASGRERERIRRGEVHESSTSTPSSSSRSGRTRHSPASRSSSVSGAGTTSPHSPIHRSSSRDRVDERGSRRNLLVQRRMHVHRRTPPHHSSSNDYVHVRHVVRREEILDALPSYVFHPDKSGKGDTEDPKPSCQICLEEYEDEEEIRILPCMHFFHKACIDHWLLESKMECPICKSDVVRAIRHDCSQGSQG